MKPTKDRQGRISAWLRLNGSTVTELAEHLEVSLGRTSTLCNSKNVPMHILGKLKTFKTENGSSIPLELLPSGQKRKPGPEKGWLDRKLDEVRREAVANA